MATLVTNINECSNSNKNASYNSFIENIGKSVSDIVVAFDNDFFVSYANESAAKLLNYKAEELLGFHISELFPKSQQDSVQVLQQSAMENQQVHDWRTCFSVKGKKQLPVSVSLALMIDGDYESGLVMIAKDNRQLVQATDALKQKNAELETLIYKISHDLKGPLASVNGLFQLYDMPGHTQEQKDHYIGLIKKSTKKLEEKLLGLLELGLSKREDIKFEAIPVREKIDEILNEFESFPGRNEVLFHTTATEGLTIETEEKLFHSVMQNLIENSIKYRKSHTDDAVTKISVRKYKDGIKIKVKDNGLGMDRDLQKRVFDMFYRGHSHTEGSGLGMFIVKTHVEKLGGEIGVKSSPQLGTEFWVYLPEQKAIDSKIRQMMVR